MAHDSRSELFRLQEGNLHYQAGGFDAVADWCMFLKESSRANFRILFRLIKKTNMRAVLSMTLLYYTHQLAS